MPSLELAARMEQALRLSRGALSTRAVKPAGSPTWRRTAFFKRFCKMKGRYRLQRDRDSWIRLRAACKIDRSLYDTCVQSIFKKHGREAFRELLHFASWDSGPEMLVWLRLLATFALIAYVPIPRLGWSRVPIVDFKTGEVVGHRLWPALIIDGPVPITLFPQVSFQGLSFCLDILACVKLDHKIVWLDVEVDGGGHRPRNDGDRARILGLRRLKVTLEDALHGDFERNLVERLIQEAQLEAA